MNLSAESSLPEGDMIVFVVEEGCERLGSDEPSSFGNPESLWAGINPFHAIVGGGVGWRGGAIGGVRVGTRSFLLRD